MTVMQTSLLWSGFAGVVLGGIITSLGTWLTAYFTARRAARDARLARRAEAYGAFLSCCSVLVNTALAVRTVLVARTGIKEGLLTALRLRSAMDPEQTIALFRRDLDPLLSAWSRVWASGTQAAIALTNDIVDASVELLKLSSSGDARGPSGTAILGSAFSERQIKDLDTQTRKIADLRREFAALIRQETGEPVATLFTDRTYN